MTNSLLMVMITFMIAVFGFHIGTAFAMHDSNLDVNTWLASDNSTQFHTIDLNKGPVSPTTATEASTPEQTTDDESTEGDLSPNGDEGEDDDGDTVFDENSDDGNSEEEE